MFRIDDVSTTYSMHKSQHISVLNPHVVRRVNRFHTTSTGEGTDTKNRILLMCSERKEQEASQGAIQEWTGATVKFVWNFKAYQQKISPSHSQSRKHPLQFFAFFFLNFFMHSLLLFVAPECFFSFVRSYFGVKDCIFELYLHLHFGARTCWCRMSRCGSFGARDVFCRMTWHYVRGLGLGHTARKLMLNRGATSACKAPFR